MAGESRHDQPTEEWDSNVRTIKNGQPVDKPLRCACGSTKFYLSNEKEKGKPIYICRECGTLCVD